MIITKAGTFSPKTNQSSNTVLAFSFLPMYNPKKVPINIAIIKDMTTLFRVMSV